MAISEFRGEYRFLSNFWLVQILFENDWYTSVESAYQAAKTLDKELREPFLSLNPAESKKLGRTLTIRQDWETVKENVMLSLLRLKFSNPILSKKLLATGDQVLIEGNLYHDTYWGVCRGVGKNRLGVLLMQVRQELKNDEMCYMDKNSVN